MTGKRKDGKVAGKAVDLDESALDAASGGDGPLWQGEESYISDVQVSSQEGASRVGANSSRSRMSVRSG